MYQKPGGPGLPWPTLAHPLTTALTLTESLKFEELFLTVSSDLAVLGVTLMVRKTIRKNTVKYS